MTERACAERACAERACAEQPYRRIKAAAEAILTERFGSAVGLAEVVRFSDEGRRNVLFRCTVGDGPGEMPPTLVIKQASPDRFKPDDPEAWSTRGLFADWAGLEFLNQSGADVTGCPRFYGGCRELGFVIMEDLGEGGDPSRILITGSAPDAERALIQLSAVLGQMHAESAGRQAEYHVIRSALGPDDHSRSGRASAEIRESLPSLLTLSEELGVQPPAGFEIDIGRVLSALDDPGPFLTYTHGDPCPDNALLTRDRLRLFDYEIGAFRHALLDGVYGRIRFPTCWCVADIPEKVVGRMDAAYRSELIPGIPMAADDNLYHSAAAQMCAVWLLRTLVQMAPRSMDNDWQWGISTWRQRVLLRLGAFGRFAAAHGQLPALCGFSESLSEKLGARWDPDTLPMPLYDAFSRPYEAAAPDFEAFLSAVGANNLPDARRLIDRDVVLVNSRLSDEECTPVLYHAVEHGAASLALLLVERGANIFATTMSGKTVLEAAVTAGDLVIVDALLNNGAKLNHRSRAGDLPVYRAIDAGSPALLQQLLERGARLDLIAAYRLDRIDLAREIVDADPSSLRRRFERGETLLHRAAADGDPKLPFLSLLLENGAGIDVTDHRGRTALHSAAAGGHEASFALLIASGADPHQKDESGKTPAELWPETEDRA